MVHMRGERVQLQIGERILQPRVFALLVAITAIVLFALAWILFDAFKSDTFGRKTAESILQLAVITILGGAFALLVEQYQSHQRKLEEAQTNHLRKLEEDKAKRLQILGRLQAQHARVALARRLIIAHDTGRTYTEQLRELMLVIPELEDITEDLKAAKSLFDPDDDKIVLGMEALVAYLTELADEYQRCYRFVNADAKAGTAVSSTIKAHGMGWVREFSTPSSKFPVDYDEALKASKGTMRAHVYGP